MSGEDFTKRESGCSIRERRGGSRLLACTAATVALGGSLWVALASESCAGCRAASTLHSEIPLAWIGAAFYAVLAVTAGWGGFSRWTKAGFFAASGAHLVLLMLLARERIFCGGCVAAGLAAMTGGVASLAARPRAGRWAAAVFAAAGLVTLGGIMTARMVQAREEAQLARELLDGEQPGSTKAGHVRLVVYEREGCEHCLEFEEQVLPRLQAALGGTLEVERREATVAMESPTIEVLGKESRLFEGLPEYQELEDAIREMR
jgi:hypothetical protein